MKKVLLLSLFGLFMSFGFAKNPEMKSAASDTTKIDMAEVNRNFKKMAKTVKEVWPEFPGGQEALDMHIAKYTTYPEDAIRMKIEGTVILGATIDTMGVITKIKILKNADPNLDYVAKRVVRQMPNFIPGYVIREYKGVERKERRTYIYTIPITFALDK